ncbi:PI-stichotoxin-Hcr2e [Taenia solium]|eukprot:TsM_001125700 transcript=TsM_001125700 gene=TsM_001125700
MGTLAALVVVAFVLADAGFTDFDAANSDAEDPCLLPVDPGPGRAYFPSYYYDAQQGACLPFVYGGLKGNANRFRNVYECEAMCIIYKT